MKSKLSAQKLFRAGLLAFMLVVMTGAMAVFAATGPETYGGEYAGLLAPQVTVHCECGFEHDYKEYTTKAIDGTYAWVYHEDPNGGYYTVSITDIGPYVDEYNNAYAEELGFTHALLRYDDNVKATHTCDEDSDSLMLIKTNDHISKYPTCTEEGIGDYECTGCGKIYKNLPIPATGHNTMSGSTKDDVDICTSPYTNYTWCGNPWCDDPEGQGTKDNPKVVGIVPPCGHNFKVEPAPNTGYKYSGMCVHSGGSVYRMCQHCGKWAPKPEGADDGITIGTGCSLCDGGSGSSGTLPDSFYDANCWISGYPGGRSLNRAPSAPVNNAGESQEEPKENLPEEPEENLPEQPEEDAQDMPKLPEVVALRSVSSRKTIAFADSMLEARTVVAADSTDNRPGGQWADFWLDDPQLAGAPAGTGEVDWMFSSESGVTGNSINVYVQGGKYAVEWRDADTDAPIVIDGEAAAETRFADWKDPTKTITVSVADADKARTFPGYTFTNDKRSVFSDELAADGSTVLILYYTSVNPAYTVRWVTENPDGGDPIVLKESDPRRDVKAEDTAKATDEDKAEIIDGYVFDADSEKNVLEKVVAADGSTVLVLYMKKSETPLYTVHWVDMATGRDLKDPEVRDDYAVGDLAQVTEPDKAVTFTGYKFRADLDQKWSDVITENGEVHLYLYYEAEGGGNNPGGDPETPPENPPENPPTTPDNPNPGEDIPTPDVPLTDLPVENPPLTELPEEETPLEDIPEEETPLSGVPETGDISALWTVMALLTGAGLIWMVLDSKKRKEDA